MIQRYWKKIKKLSYVIIFFIVALFFFVKPVEISRIIPKNTVSIEIKGRVVGGTDKRVVIDNISVIKEILDKYTYRKSLLYSFSMNSWYGDTLKLYCMDGDGRDIVKLYVIVHEMSKSALIMNSDLGVVYKVNGEHPEEIYNSLKELFR